MLIYEKCENPEVVVDGGKVARNVDQKKKSDVLQDCECHFVTNANARVFLQ